jgi:drug/metabolite transporter (DMT)-like permease
MSASGKPSTNITIMTYMLIIFSVALAMTGQICLRRGMVSVKASFGGDQKLTEMLKEDPVKLVKEIATNWQVLLGLLLFVASAASWLIVLADVPLGVAYPFVSLTYVVVLLYDWKIDKSYDVNIWNWLGVGAIVAGVLMISVGRNKQPEVIDSTP